MQRVNYCFYHQLGHRAVIFVVFVVVVVVVVALYYHTHTCLSPRISIFAFDTDRRVWFLKVVIKKFIVG